MKYIEIIVDYSSFIVFTHLFRNKVSWRFFKKKNFRSVLICKERGREGERKGNVDRFFLWKPSIDHIALATSPVVFYFPLSNSNSSSFCHSCLFTERIRECWKKHKTFLVKCFSLIASCCLHLSSCCLPHFVN